MARPRDHISILYMIPGLANGLVRLHRSESGQSLATFMLQTTEQAMQAADRAEKREGIEQEVSIGPQSRQLSIQHRIHNDTVEFVTRLHEWF